MSCLRLLTSDRERRRYSPTVCAILLATMLSQACSTDRAEWVSRNNENRSEHFVFYKVGNVPDEVMETISSELSQHRGRIVKSLGVLAMPQVRVKVYADYESFSEAFGAGIAGGRAFVNPDKNEVYVLNVSHADVGKTTVHEFAHLVVAMVNRNIPRWLWESAAIYEAQETIGDGSTLSCITQSQYPTLEELNKSHTTYDVKVYRVGYSLIEYVVSEFGDEGRMDLIRSGGDIQSALGVTTSAFEEGWHKFVLDKYNIQKVGSELNIQQVLANMAGRVFTNSDDAYRFSLNSDGSIDFTSPLIPRFFGLPDAPSMQGEWTVSSDGEVCISSPDFDDSSCVPWYLGADRVYRQTIKNDCKWFEWHRDE